MLLEGQNTKNFALCMFPICSVSDGLAASQTDKHSVKKIHFRKRHISPQKMSNAARQGL